LGGSDIDVQPLLDTAIASGVPVALFDETDPETHRLYKCSLTLIRPDQYVAWRGDSLPDDPSALLSLVIGRT
jgi:hypothetical protein